MARLGVVGVIAAALIAALMTYLSARMTFDASMVAAGVGILSQEPEGTSSVATRQWAGELIEKALRAAIQPDAREALKTHSLGGGRIPPNDPIPGAGK